MIDMINERIKLKEGRTNSSFLAKALITMTHLFASLVVRAMTLMTSMTSAITGTMVVLMVSALLIACGPNSSPGGGSSGIRVGINPQPQPGSPNLYELMLTWENTGALNNPDIRSYNITYEAFATPDAANPIANGGGRTPAPYNSQGTQMISIPNLSPPRYITITNIVAVDEQGLLLFSVRTATSLRLIAIGEDEDDDNILDEIDVDEDGDGLIEIGTANELGLIRNDLRGRSLNDGVSSNTIGCPNAANPAINPPGSSGRITNCNGYELTADIDLTNMAGGWTPIGRNIGGGRFSAVFEGNGFRINDMQVFIDASLEDGDPDSDSGTRTAIGFFGAIENARIRNVHLINASVLLSGLGAGTVRSVSNVGGLVGIARGSSSIIASSIFADTIQGTDNVGGLIGSANGPVQVAGNAAISRELGLLRDGERISNSGNIVGGLVGQSAGSSARYVNNYAVVRYLRGSRTGGLAGLARNSNFGNGWAITALVNNSTRSSDSAADRLEIGALFGQIEQGFSIISGTSLLWTNDGSTSVFSNTGRRASQSSMRTLGPAGAPTGEDQSLSGAIVLSTAEFIDGTARFDMSVTCDSASRAGSATSSWSFTQGLFPTINCFANSAADGLGMGISTGQQATAITQVLNRGTLSSSGDFSDNGTPFATIIAGLRQQ